MNLTSNLEAVYARMISQLAQTNLPRVFIDTTVLCGSLRTPNGINDRIITFARASTFFVPVFSDVCLLEFYRNAHEGLGKKKPIMFNHEEIMLYLDNMIFPTLENYPAVNSSVGRYAFEVVVRQEKPLGEVLIELSKCTEKTAKEIAASQELKEPLKN